MKGVPGPKGDSGMKGNKGDTGRVGLIGKRGPRGLTGINVSLSYSIMMMMIQRELLEIKDRKETLALEDLLELRLVNAEYF